jgi:hypothetical protein
MLVLFLRMIRIPFNSALTGTKLMGAHVTSPTAVSLASLMMHSTRLMRRASTTMELHQTLFQLIVAPNRPAFHGIFHLVPHIAA